MTVIKNFFILEKEQRAFTHLVKNKIYEYNGILYGDIVINTILVKYFKNEFINNKNNFSDYWNEKIDEKTKLRTLTSNKIDVYFKNLDDYVNFIEYLKHCDDFNITKTVSLNNQYNYLKNIYRLTRKIGYSFTTAGTILDLELNILLKLPVNQMLEPPFNKTIMITDLLIMTKNGPRISKNTGIPKIDKMNLVKKTLLFSKIIENICNLNTYILSTKYIKNTNNLYYDILQLMNNKWYIINSPLKKIKVDEKKTNCLICLDDIDNSENIIELNTTCKSILHEKCIKEYIHKKLEKDEEIICPLRQKIELNVDTNKIIDDILLKN